MIKYRIRIGPLRCVAVLCCACPRVQCAHRTIPYDTIRCDTTRYDATAGDAYSTKLNSRRSNRAWGEQPRRANEERRKEGRRLRAVPAVALHQKEQKGVKRSKRNSATRSININAPLLLLRASLSYPLGCSDLAFSHSAFVPPLLWQALELRFGRSELHY